MPDESDVINRVREICCCVNPNKHVFKNIFCFSKSWRVIDSWGSASLVCVRVCSLIFVIRSNFPSPGPREISARGATFIILVYIPRCIIYLTLILQKRQRVSARNASSFHSCLTDSKVYRQLSKSNKSLSFFIELLRWRKNNDVTENGSLRIRMDVARPRTMKYYVVSSPALMPDCGRKNLCMILKSRCNHSHRSIFTNTYTPYIIFFDLPLIYTAEIRRRALLIRIN